MIKNILVFVGVVFAISLPFILIPNTVKIKRIDCRSQYGICTPITENELGKVPLSTVSKTKVDLENLLKNSSRIKGYSINFKFPETLIVTVLEAKPSYALKNEELGTTALVDENGSVVSIVQLTGIREVKTSEVIPNVGESVDEKTLFALRLIKKISAYEVEEATLIDRTLVVDLANSPKVIFPLTGDIDVLSGSLSLILSRLKEGSENLRIEETGSVREIDLQYKNPVLRT